MQKEYRDGPDAGPVNVPPLHQILATQIAMLLTLEELLPGFLDRIETHKTAKTLAAAKEIVADMQDDVVTIVRKLIGFKPAE